MTADQLAANVEALVQAARAAGCQTRRSPRCWVMPRRRCWKDIPERARYLRVHCRLFTKFFPVPILTDWWQCAALCFAE
jgi:hypothetical protein